MTYILTTSPMYQGLKNNIATRLMQTKLQAWPEGTPDFVTHEVFKNYIQEISRNTGVEELTSYGARVTEIKKEGQKWSLIHTVLGQNSHNIEDQHKLVGFKFTRRKDTHIY